MNGGADAVASRSRAATRTHPFKGWKKLPWAWHKVYRHEAARTAQNAAFSLDMRVWLLAISRAGFNGHAEFKGGELVATLTKVNKSTGELGTYDLRRIQQVIREGVDANIYGPGSTARCIIVASHLVDVDRPPGNWRGCREHTHRYRWYRDSWATIDGAGHMGYVLDDGSVHFLGKARNNTSSVVL